MLHGNKDKELWVDFDWDGHKYEIDSSMSQKVIGKIYIKASQNVLCSDR